MLTDDGTVVFRSMISGVGDGVLSASIATASGACCAADFDQNGAVSVGDLLDFVQRWFAGNAMTDLDDSGSVSLSDLIGFVQAYLGGCR